MAEQKRIEGSCRITAAMDGTTLIVSLISSGLPMVQRYSQETNFVYPDFAEASKKGNEPTVSILAVDTMTGIYRSTESFSSVEWSYNGKTLQFDSQGMSTNSGLEGVFKKNSREIQVTESQKILLPSLSIVANIAIIGGRDDDRITASGVVEVNGQQLPFGGVNKRVIIEEETNSAYSLDIHFSPANTITNTVNRVTATAILVKNSSDIGSNFTYKWYRMETSGPQIISGMNSKSIIISDSDVNSELVIGCDAIDESSNVVASAYDKIYDISDAWRVFWEITGIQGETIRYGETAVVKPTARRTANGETATGDSWSFIVYDNRGVEVRRAQGASLNVTYSEVIGSGKGCMNIVASRDL